MKKNSIVPYAIIIGSVLSVFIFGVYLGQNRISSSATAAEGRSARAVLYDSSGARVGRTVLRQMAGRVRIDVRVSGIPPGDHGLHIHTTGKCEAPAFTTAGGHFNPDAKEHGLKNPNGPHMGDIPNLIINQNGRGNIRMFTQLKSLSSLFDSDGSAVVIHAVADDYLTNPAGNAGARIACGVLYMSADEDDDNEEIISPTGIEIPISNIPATTMPITVVPSTATPSCIPLPPDSKYCPYPMPTLIADECVWCGNQCIDGPLSPDRMCSMIAPPQSARCTRINGRCRTVFTEGTPIPLQ